MVKTTQVVSTGAICLKKVTRADDEAGSQCALALIKPLVVHDPQRGLSDMGARRQPRRQRGYLSGSRVNSEIFLTKRPAAHSDEQTAQLPDEDYRQTRE